MQRTLPYPAVDILFWVKTAIFLIRENKLIYVNPEFERMTGNSTGECTGTPLLNYIFADHRSRVESALHEILNGSDIAPFDVQLIDKNGHGICVQAQLSAVRENGHAVVAGVLTHVNDRHLHQEETRWPEDKYRSVLNGIQEVYFETDLRGRITFANNALSRHLGYSKEELIGMSHRMYTDPACHPILYEAFHNLYLTGQPIKAVEELIIRKDGSRGVSELSVSLIRDAAGTPVGFAGISRDVTDRKAMEEALRQSEERYRSIIENIQDGYIEVGLDGRWNFFNDRVCEHMQYSRDELLAMDFHQMHTEESAQRTVKAFTDVYRTGMPIKSIEIEGVRKDGSIGNFELSVSLMKNNRGQATGFRCISRDITARKKMESDLLQSEERYRTIINEMEEWYLESDRKGNLLFYNEILAKSLGFEPASLGGRNFRDIVAPDQAEIIYQLFHRVFETGQPEKNVPYRFTGPDGSVKHAEFSIFAKRDREGRIIGFRAVGHDITEKKRVQVQQMLTEKMASLGQLAAGAAARINHPISLVGSNLKTLSEYLSDITGCLGLAKALPHAACGDTKTDIDRLKKQIQEMESLFEKLKIDFVLEDIEALIKESQDSVERIHHIIRDLESYEETADDQPKFDDINANLETALNKVWNELKYKAVITRSYGEIPKIRCYPRQLNQVFVNLLLNAVQAIEEEGEIIITTRSKPDGYIEIVIEDSGAGISEEHLPKIFDPFFTTKTTGQATGLGLHVASSIIRRHQGTIAVDSANGRGTTLTILLPVN